MPFWPITCVRYSMTRARCSLLACAALLMALLPRPAAAAFMADPRKLYAQMEAAYAKGTAQGWTFYNQEQYLSTLFDAGRAYALQLPGDPEFPVIEQETVDVASGTHYDPLINHDAVPWYVRQAAVYVETHNAEPSEVAKAKALLDRVNALDDPVALATFADADSAANLASFPRDANAELQRVEANWRGWLITHDASWRSLSLARADTLDFPLAHLPSTWGPGFLNAVLNASHGVAGYSAEDVAHAQAIEARVAALPQLKVIARVRAVPEAGILTTLAPADEYFGPLEMSILGMENELKHINFMLNYGYGNRESAMAVQVAVSLDDLHKVYPRDRDVPKMLYAVYQTLGRLTTPQAQAARTKMYAILTVEYEDTPQAREVLGS